MDDTRVTALVRKVLEAEEQADKEGAPRGYPGAIVEYTDHDGDKWPAIIVRSPNTKNAGKCHLSIFMGKRGVGAGLADYNSDGEPDTWQYIRFST